jgi:NTP pyrophosphatase (non-canonical NTP hydrolase)
MTYYLYHIPGKKIGVTCDLNNRVTKQQGYAPDEYEILERSEDIDFISSLELELQREYGYRVDMVPYKNLKPKNKMKINITEQTTTFPVPVNKLKGRLMDNIGMTWETEHGSCIITAKSVSWIMENVKTSMYNNDRSYVYNKAFARWFDNNNAYETKTGGLAPTGPRSMDAYSPQKKYSHQRTLKMFDNIRDWAKTRGLYDKGNSHTQYVKLQEEAGELAKALLDNDGIEILDAIGDIVVVLTNLAHLEGFTIEQCIESAYEEISDRTGKMINGTFVKDAN